MTRFVEVTARSQREGSPFRDVWLYCQFYFRSSERISDVLAVLIPACDKWTVAFILIVQGYGKYQASYISKKKKGITNQVGNSSSATHRRKKVKMLRTVALEKGRKSGHFGGAKN